MSHDTLKAWDACAPANWGKHIEDMNADELDTLAGHLTAFLIGMAEDYGIATAGQDPAEFSGGSHLDGYADGDDIRQARRDMIESGTNS